MHKHRLFSLLFIVKFKKFVVVFFYLLKVIIRAEFVVKNSVVTDFFKSAYNFLPIDRAVTW